MKYRNTVIIFTAVLVCFLLFTAVSIISLTNMAQENTREINTMLTYRLYDEISTGINEPIAVSRAMCSDTLLIEAVKKEATMDEAEAVKMMKDYLGKIRTEFGYDTAFFISEKTRRYFTHDGLNKIIDVDNDAHDIWYKNFVDSNESYIIDVDTDEVNEVQWTLFMDFRLEDENGNFLGVCGVGTRMYNIQNAFSETQKNHNVKINFVDKNGLVQIDTDDNKIEADRIDMTGVSSTEDGISIHISNEKHELTVFKYIEPLKWYLVVRSSTDEINRNFRSIITLNIIISLVITVIVLSILAIISRRSDKKNALAERVSKQLAATSDIYISVYELDLLNDTFNAISDNTGSIDMRSGFVSQGAQQNITSIYSQNTDPSSREHMLEFVDLSTLSERLRNTNTVTHEFMSIKKKWRRARFIVSERTPAGDVARALYLVEDIDEEKRDSYMMQNTAKLLTSQLDCLANIYTSVHDFDIPNDSFSIIKMNDTFVQNAIGNDVHNARKVFQDTMTKLTDESCRKEVLEFVEVSNIEKNVAATGTATVEFINSRGKWCRGRFIVSERTEDGGLSHVIWAVENIDAEKRERDRLSEDARALADRISSITNIFMTVHEFDVASDTFTEIKSQSRIVNSILNDVHNDPQGMLRKVMTKVTDDSSMDDVMRFIDLSTLDRRLSRTDTIAVEYMNKQKLWRRGRFVASRRDENGHLTRVLWLSEDIDNEKRERNELINASARAIAANEAQAAFLSGMSEKIRKPINEVLETNEKILRKTKDKEIIDCAKSIKKSESDLLGKVSDILDFTMIEAGKMEINSVDYDLSDVIGELTDIITPQANDKGLRFELEINRHTPRHLNGDPVRVKQVIENLLTNAVKFTEKGTVTLCIRPEAVKGEPDSVMLNVSVRDTGSGITKEDIRKISSETDHAAEAGLGISITKSLLGMMDSELVAESIYGLGSKFSFELKQTVVKWDELGGAESDIN